MSAKAQNYRGKVPPVKMLRGPVPPWPVVPTPLSY